MNESQKRRRRGLASLWRPARPGVLAFAAGMLLLLGCASDDRAVQPAGQLQQKSGRADDFLIVDCLLPGQVRRLGRQATFITARQAIKTSAGDCGIRGGEYVAFDRANYATALKVWLPLAEQGDAAAQTYVGEIFEKGLGVPPDYAAAAKWYRQAAEQNYPRAAINLGNLLERGLGGPKDPAQALNWYRRAAGSSEFNFEIVPGKNSEELQQLRGQIEELRGQLQAKQTEVDRTRDELERLRRTLDERRGEAESERRSLERLRKELNDLRAKSAGATPRLNELELAIAEGSTRLAGKEREVADLRASYVRAEATSNSQRSELEREVAGLRASLKEAEKDAGVLRAGLKELKEQTAEAGPKIELVQVQLIAPELVPTTRDIRVLPKAASDTGPAVMMVGRVTSSAGLKSFTINQREQTLEQDGVFKAQIPIEGPGKETGRRIELVATDRNGRSSKLALLMPVVEVSLRDRDGVPRRDPQPGPGSRRPKLSFGNYHALVIGNNDYRQLPRLKTAVNDATEVARILKEQYRFRVTLLTNATRQQILSELNALRETLTDKDNLLIYYAGHGYLAEKTQRGYWLPVEADPKNRADWITNFEIADQLKEMKVRQVLVVADSCYSGTMTRGLTLPPEAGLTEEDLAEAIQKLAQGTSRMAMTSGGLEPVADSGGGRHSIFAEVFIQILRSNDRPLPGQDVFRQLQRRVILIADRLEVPQVPEYGQILLGGHVFGDFIFVPAGS